MRVVLLFQSWSLLFKKQLRGAQDIMRRISRLSPTQTLLLICDIQTRFRPLIFRAESVINRSVLLNEAAIELGIPRIITEQYPKVRHRTTCIQYRMYNFLLYGTQYLILSGYRLLVRQLMRSAKKSQKDWVHVMYSKRRNFRWSLMTFQRSSNNTPLNHTLCYFAVLKRMSVCNKRHWTS